MFRGTQAGNPSLGSLGKGLRRQEPERVWEQPGEDDEGNIPDRGTASTEAWGGGRNPLCWTQGQARVRLTEVSATSVASSLRYLPVSRVQLEFPPRHGIAVCAWV